MLEFEKFFRFLNFLFVKRRFLGFIEIEETSSGMSLAPLARIPTHYQILIFAGGILMVFLCIFAIVYLRCRQKSAKTKKLGKTNKNFMERINVNIKEMQMTVVPENGHAYILDSDGCQLQKLPSAFQFPPMPHPPPDYSDYVDPADFNKSAATLPLLPPTSSSSTSTSSGRHGAKILTSPKRARTPLSVPPCSPGSSSGPDSVHYAASDLGCPIRAGQDSPAFRAPIRQYALNQLKPIQKLGEGDFGEVHICEASGIPEIAKKYPMVAVKLLRQNASPKAR